MGEKLLPAILMTLLSFASLSIIIRGLQLAMRKTAWTATTQKNILAKQLLHFLHGSP